MTGAPALVRARGIGLRPELLVARAVRGFFGAVFASAARRIHEGAEDFILHRPPTLVVARGNTGHRLGRIDADDRFHLFAQLTLLRAEQLHALLEIAAEDVLQIAAVRADD